jgi:hypothetical protein
MSSSDSTFEAWSTSSASTTSDSSDSTFEARSTSSLSSLTETFSSASESSSADVVYTSKSSVVFQTPVKNPNWAVYAATLDLDELDLEKTRRTAWHYVDMSGTYHGFVVAVYRVKIEDGAKFVLRIAPRQYANEEKAILEEWTEALLSRVRAALVSIREEYDASMNPGDLPRGNYL